MRRALDPAHVEALYDRAARRYDLYHGLVTFRADERGRRRVVAWGVRPGDDVLDAGGGTAGTAILAARRVGASGHVTVVDRSAEMLRVGRARAHAAGLLDRISFVRGDILALPFPDGRFDAVLTTYSLCPIDDPVRGALEMYRVVRSGGRLACAHSAEPEGTALRRVARGLEDVLWRLPAVSLGCRSVNILPALTGAGAHRVRATRIGVPLWPFLVFVVEKPGRLSAPGAAG